MTPAAGEVPLTGTVWNVVELNGSPATGPRLELDPDGARIAAHGGCNTIGGAYELSGSRLRADGPLMMTKRACAERQRNVTENEFVKALEAMRSYAISGRTLILYSQSGAEIAKLEAAADR